MWRWLWIWVGLGWKNGRECERAHLLERLRAWKKYLYYFFCPPILGVVLSHLLMTDWQNLGKPWELPWMTLRIYSKSKVQKSLLKYVPLTSNCLEISDKNEFTMDEHCRWLKWLCFVGMQQLLRWSGNTLGCKIALHDDI